MKKGNSQETAFRNEQPQEQKFYGWIRCTHGVPNPIIDPVKKLAKVVCDACLKMFPIPQEAFAT
jgi:hypothetical protein